MDRPLSRKCRVQNAFVLGAGKGTRLRPLTEEIPKPLVPLVHRPLVTYAFDHLASVGIERFVVNTHHCAEAWETSFPDSDYLGKPVDFRFEPVLLETGGGIANVADLLGNDPFLVYNGDILTDLPLEPALERHASSDAIVTMILRSEGHALHVGFDATTGLVPDIRNLLETGQPSTHQFTGIYLCNPEIHQHLRGATPHSVIGPFLELAKIGKLGGVVIDEGSWLDLGTRDAYLDAQIAVLEEKIMVFRDLEPPIHPSAQVHAEAEIGPGSVIGSGATVGANVRISQSVLWPGSKVIGGSNLERCIVRTGRTATGTLTNEDI
ncbi:MAG: sugar phosphate nucleotidyltransferase [Verrucomicrobiota bacterium]